MNLRNLSLFLLVLTITSCNKPTLGIMLPAEEGEVMIELDSVGLPELAAFPMRLKLTNNTNKKVVLVFDTISNEYKDQVRNMFVTANPDTFLLGVRTKKEFLIFNPHTSTSFLGFGYFIYGRGHFESFEEINAVLTKGRLEYRFNRKNFANNALKEILAVSDTVVVPSKLEASTGNAQVVDRFLPQSLEWREKKL
ncbi:hypothetical protein [Pontibacter russatus]|uniref:hypothetical protein n=1 Tax=Pontibacter russatus TaxID=2694929 RepID=UPI0013796271|nr:hypothetical protein [Pontibacter russatus]